jgi:hypothetical protein
MWKQFQKNLEIVLEHENYSEHSENSRKISQRHIRTRSIQIKYLDLMKKILEPSNK